MTMLSAIRRSLFALGLAGVIAAYLRMNGAEENSPSGGGWRELSGPELD